MGGREFHDNAEDLSDLQVEIVKAESRLSGLAAEAHDHESRSVEVGDEEAEFKALEDFELQPGELYLFLVPGSREPLLGVYGHETHRGGILLEAATFDQQRYATWYLLPPGYSLCRRATRAELRDFFYNLARYESIPTASRSVDGLGHRR